MAGHRTSQPRALVCCTKEETSKTPLTYKTQAVQMRECDLRCLRGSHKTKYGSSHRTSPSRAKRASSLIGTTPSSPPVSCDPTSTCNKTRSFPSRQLSSNRSRSWTSLPKSYSSRLRISVVSTSSPTLKRAGLNFRPSVSFPRSTKFSRAR